ncbi:MAG: hypothetical protein VYC80_00005, partial [Planctomycetota bacterium]|nr:hypothetical protein [Planctomycetota bacterium]
SDPDGYRFVALFRGVTEKFVIAGDDFTVLRSRGMRRNAVILQKTASNSSFAAFIRQLSGCYGRCLSQK